MEEIRLISPAEGETVEICAPFQKEFYEADRFRKIRKIIKQIMKEKKPSGFFSTPAPAVFSWEPADCDAVLEFSENEDFSDSETVTAKSGRAEVYNLKKHTEYFWRVNGGEARSFFTDSVMPRWIYAEGMENIRDFGGEKNTEGIEIKQGLVFRGARMEHDGAEKAFGTLRKLGIKTDLDLRSEIADKLSDSPLGEDIKFILHPCTAYEGFLLEDKKGSSKKLIEYFADESIYPVYFHCHGGQDRTGTLAFFLGAILGLDDKTLLREYELTMVTYPDKKLSRSRKQKFRLFLKLLKKRNKNKTYAENAIDFLYECGVTEETMDSIREIMLRK